MFSGFTKARLPIPFFKIGTTSTLILVYLMIIAGCSWTNSENPILTEESPKQQSVENPRFPIDIPNGQGGMLRLNKFPERIISLSPAMTEIIFALKADKNLVAVDDFSDYPAQAMKLPKVGNAYNVDLEQIVHYNPDLVLLSFARFVPAIESLGIPVLFQPPPEDLAGVLEIIKLTGNWTGNPHIASDLINNMEERIDATVSEIDSVSDRPIVFYELDPLLYTVGPSSFVGNLLTLLKAENLVHESEGAFPQLSAEIIISRDPDIIILGDSSEFTPQKETVMTVQSRAGWGSISAVKEGRIYTIDPSLISRPGPRIVDGLEKLASLIYPSKFSQD